MTHKVMLTVREKEILELIFKGHTRNEIACQLYISPETVKKHIQNSYRKLDAKNKIEALHKMKWLSS
jgi:DNA-binding CsgD family transcriptional regulator